MITITLKVKENKEDLVTQIIKTITKNKATKKEETAAIVLNNKLIELLTNLDK